MTYLEIINSIDKGITPELVATLAGLALATVTFLAPLADTKMKEAQTELERLERIVGEAKQRGIFSETPNQKRLEVVAMTVKDISEAQNALVRAFLIFVWFLVYTITADQIVNENFFTDVLKMKASDSMIGVSMTADLSFSMTLMILALRNLWIGAKSIRNYFTVNFDAEKKKLREIESTVREIMNRKG